MKRLIEFPLQQGGTLIVEVDEPEIPGQVVRASTKPGEIAETAKQTFEEALDKIKPAAQSIVTKLRGLPDAPDEIEVEFGIKLNAVAGVIVASAGVEANYKVTLKWVKSQSSKKRPQRTYRVS